MAALQSGGAGLPAAGDGEGAGHISPGKLLQEEAGDIGAGLVRVGDGENSPLQLVLCEEGHCVVNAAGVQVCGGIFPRLPVRYIVGRGRSGGGRGGRKGGE